MSSRELYHGTSCDNTLSIIKTLDRTGRRQYADSDQLVIRTDGPDLEALAFEDQLLTVSSCAGMPVSFYVP